MFNDLDEGAEETKTNGDGNKKNNKREKGEFKSKGKVDQSKIDNKRKAKEGNKQSKLNKQKGIVKNHDEQKKEERIQGVDI